MCVNSSESRRFTNVLSFVGIGQFSTRLPYVSATLRFTLCRRCCRPRGGAGPKCCVLCISASSAGFAARFSGATLDACSGISGTPSPWLGACAVSKGIGRVSVPSYTGADAYAAASPAFSGSSYTSSWLFQLGGGSLPFDRRWSCIAWS